MDTAAATTSLEFAALRPVALRFVWKEWRVLRGLALGMIGLAGVEMLVSLGFLRPTDRSAWMVISAFGGAALFAVGAAVMLFAVEREEGTATLLELLPQNRPAMFFGKIAAAVLMSLLVLVILILFGLALAGGQLPSEESLHLTFSQGSVILAEALAWGVLMSLLCPNPLLAAVLALAAAAFNSQVAMALTVRDAAGFTADDFQAAIPGRLALVAMVAAIDVLIGLRWLHGPASPRVFSKLTRLSATPAATKTVQQEIAMPSRLSMFGRLVWQTLRQSWKAAIAAIVIGLFLMFAVEAILSAFVRLNLFWAGAKTPVSALFIPALLGALVFRADQRNRQYRFLAEHAGSPRMLWIARQSTWLALTIIVGAAVFAVGWWNTGDYLQNALHSSTSGVDVFDLGSDTRWSPAIHSLIENNVRFTWQVVLGAGASWLAAYAVGQLLSLTLTSDVLAGILSLIASVILLFWFYLVVAWNLSPFFFVLPIAAVALTASWLRTKSWIFERRGLRRWILPAVVLVIPILYMLSLVPVVRYMQVRWIYPLGNNHSINIHRLADEAGQQIAAGREALDQYNILSGRIGEATQEGDMTVVFPSNSSTFDDEILTLSQIDGRFPSLQNDPRFGKIEVVGYFAYLRARALFSQDLDKSLQMLLAGARIQSQLHRGLSLEALARGQSQARAYWHNWPDSFSDYWTAWASAEGQTPERIKRAIESLRDLDQRSPSPTDGVVNDYLAARAVIGGERPPSFLNNEHRDERDWVFYHLSRFPGETQRGQYALILMATAAVEFCQDAASFMSTSHPGIVGIWRAQLKSSHHDNGSLRVYHSPFSIISTVRDAGLKDYDFFQRQADSISAARTSYLAADELEFRRWLPGYLGRWFADATRRRLERVRLALVGYRLEHGEYPATLKALTPEYLWESEIRDPYSAELFGYRPEGFAFPFAHLSQRRQTLEPAKTPLLWTVGEEFSTPEEADVWVQMNDDGVPIGVVNDRSMSPNVPARQAHVVKLVPRELNPAYQWVQPLARAGYGAHALALPINFDEE